MTSAVCHLTRSYFYGCHKCEWNPIAILRDQPLSTPSRWEVSGWLNWSLWLLLVSPVRKRPPHRQKDGKPGTITGDVFPLYISSPQNSPKCLISDLTQLRMYHCIRRCPEHHTASQTRGNSQREQQGSRWSRLKGSQLWMWPQPQDPCDSDSSSGRICLYLPISDPHCHESSPCSARIMCLCIPLHGGEGSRTPREYDVDARITHASKGLEFCNPLNTRAFRNIF